MSDSDSPKPDFEKALENLSIPTEKDPEYYRAIAHLWANGADTPQIAIMLGQNIAHIQEVMDLPRVKDLSYDIKKKMAGRDHDRLFKALVPDATDVVRRIMSDTSVKESTRLTAALAIIDRAMGKPMQKLEVGGSLLRDLFDRLDTLDQIHESRAIEAESKRLHNEQGKRSAAQVEEAEYREEKKGTPDAAATWVEENIK